jgi:hypothetical protein
MNNLDADKYGLGIGYSYNSSSNAKIWNNLVYGWIGGSGSRGIMFNSGNGYEKNWYIYNNTVYNSGSGIFVGGSGTHIAKNNIAQSCTDGYSGSVFDSSSDYNISDLANDAPSPSYRPNLATDVTFVDEPNDDFHLASTDTEAKDAGTNLSADADLPFSTDIDGQARTVNAWDIGADEWRPAGKYTMSVWVKPSTSVATKAVVGKAEELRLATNASGQPLCQIKSDGTWQTAATSSSAISVDEWWQVICAYDRVAMRVYVNGLLKGEQALTAAPDDTNSIFEIGHDASSGSTYGSYAGLVDSYRFFAYAMTDSQVKTEYNFGKSVRLGSSGTVAATGAPTNAASGEYCVPGDTSPCAPPVGEWKMDEKGGSTAYDTSGNGNDGTISGATAAIGKLGQGLDFNGTTSYINAGSGSSLDDIETQGGGGMTVSAWIKPRTYGESNVGHIAGKTGGSGLWQLRMDGYNNRLQFYKDYSVTDLNLRLNSWGSLNVWNHIVLTWDGSPNVSGVHFFANGIESSTSGTGGQGTKNSESALNFYIAGTPYDSFNGVIDQVRIYNYARTLAQIAWEYNKGKPVAQWSFNEATGNTAHNEVTNTLHGTRQNMEDADWVSGKFGNALDFDGSNEYVSIGDTNINLNAVSFWINADAATDDIIDLDGGTHTVTVSSGTIVANGFSSPTIYVDGEEAAAITTGNWHHVLIKTDTAFEASNLNVARIGSSYFDGKLDDVRIYNYAPTAEQVRQIVNASSAAQL